MLRYTLLFGFVGLLWIVALVLIFGPMYQPQCQWYRYDESYYEGFASLQCVFAASFQSGFVWIGDNSVGISTAISAAATIFIARFTLTLKRSTDNLFRTGEDQAKAALLAARAAQASADSLPTVERAYVFGGIRGQVQASGEGHAIVSLLISNFGRTPALIREFAGKFVPTEPVAADYSDADVRTADAVLQGDPNVGMGGDTRFQSRLTGHQFFLGYVQYLDIFRKPHTSRFCMLVRPAEGTHQVAGGPELNNWD